MPSRSKLWLRGFACVTSTAMLAGCADYLNHRDSVTLAAGDAQDWNRVVHTIDPWPPHVKNTDIDGDGQRIAAVIGRYSTADAPQGSTSEATPVSEGPAEVN